MDKWGFDKSDPQVLLLCQRASECIFVDLLQIIKDKFHCQESIITQCITIWGIHSRESIKKENPIFIFKSVCICL